MLEDSPDSSGQLIVLVSDIVKRLERLEKLIVQSQIDERAALLARAGTIGKVLGLEKKERR